ncbi:hypothetical protein EZ428_19540 [Pedobacter frigiditerrae]|uniref:SusE outer membrane protein domain-containing protein n=1 Tax=Pedobacter frigiditerrae TaxID=2530452 RepID=A0A4R0MMH2_9SPHI|nr:SusE domain-containing protein [Pedobacter frigiditerrae]TCC87928.1 hypothetical protein EZ428_19540 [Pedobacter frigiditerrae]
MKRTIKHLFALGISGLIFMQACRKDDSDMVETTITAPVSTAPSNNTSVVLSPSSNAVVTFEWDQSKTGNYTSPFYKVVFAKEDGDFSKPIYAIVSTKLGYDSKVAVSHREMNKMAYAAGIKQLEKGKVKWRIEASNGVVGMSSAVSTMELTRPAGIAENPATLFITGTATEGGTDLNKALPLKRLSDGVFEVYTALSTGNYKLIDNVTNASLTAVIDAGVIKEALEIASPTTTKKVYRINIDFNTASATFTEIQTVGIWVSGFNAIKYTLDYDAAGVWKANNVAIAWKPESWGRDERYKFRVTEKDVAGVVTVKNWGGSVKDNVRPTLTTALTYYLLKPVDNTQYDFAFKFALEAPADIEFRMSALADYTQKITYK